LGPFWWDAQWTKSTFAYRGAHKDSHRDKAAIKHRFREYDDPRGDGTVAGRKAIVGALLDFVNMFMMFLRLLGEAAGAYAPRETARPISGEALGLGRRALAHQRERSPKGRIGTQGIARVVHVGQHGAA
jgi:hypothetical protein